jgi:phospholipid transport system transporter-binding protein
LSSATDSLPETVATGVEFRDRGGGRFEILGELSFQTAATALEKSKAVFSKHSIIEIDLAGVTRADSAGLALMLEWVNRARNNAHDLRFTNIPAQIISIAEISEVEDMLYRGERWTGA